MAHILNVPLEVVLQITSYLTTPEYGYLRRTCKQLEALLFGAFTKEFFSKRQFALVEFSIQALVDIAKSRLGPSLTHLIIHLEHPHNTVINSSSVEKAVQHNQYKAECVNHLEFISSGLDVDMLSDAIKHLPNLETIGMRDFHSLNRSRDGTLWHSHGCPTFVRKTQYRLAIPAPTIPYMGNYRGDRGSEYTSHVFLTILRAIGNAAVVGCNPKLTRIEVLLHTCQFPDQSFKIPDRFDDQISSVLSKLTTIFLDNLMEDEHQEPLFFVRDVGDKTEPARGVGYFLSRFLVKLSALEHLRLNFQSYKPRAVEHVLGWLADAKQDSTDPTANPVDSIASANVRLPLVTPLDMELTAPYAKASDSLPVYFPPAPYFPKLRALEIGMAVVQESQILAVFERYKSTLRRVGFHKTTLSCPVATKFNPWARLCNKMAKADLKLEMLGLSYVKQTSGGTPTRNGEVTFRGSRNKYVKIWRGSTFSRSIKDMIEDMESRWDDISDNADDDGLSTLLGSVAMFLLLLTTEAESMDDDEDDDDDDDDDDLDDDDDDDDNIVI
ncbi:hypothetical protein E0Z10_g9960 [Xylaria hypoxylon]|uniref:F-box domain-containing protein n=1 Tax=Xylaria hypoxylon TaxID=37992 RepID=A0A4Z0YJE7_9PEZI|nr:hypothetical protein E0Z10_g9960 [Xylaria hypoxylon]